MHITMVTKRSKDGSDCPKCEEAKRYLQGKGYWERIDEIIPAQVGQPDSEGFKLAVKHQVDTAPFFIVREDGEERIYRSVLRLAKDVLER